MLCDSSIFFACTLYISAYRLPTYPISIEVCSELCDYFVYTFWVLHSISIFLL
uniref:Uncharacterized protein n=1 Tax=Arundo donax TaxID=35708 RepID=A0A0A9DE61_ARUDO